MPFTVLQCVNKDIIYYLVLQNALYLSIFFIINRLAFILNSFTYKLNCFPSSCYLYNTFYFGKCCIIFMLLCKLLTIDY